MPTTPKGFRYPLGTQPAADIELFFQQLAEDVDAMPGIAIVSTAVRDAFTAGQKWTGRVIYNTTVSGFEYWNGAAWAALGDPNAVPKTLVDAKGDLLVATGSDTVARHAAGTNGQIPVFDSAQGDGIRNASLPVIPLATFSKAGALSVTTGQHEFVVAGAWTITEVIARVGTAPTGASVIVDVNREDVTIFTTQSERPTIAAGTFQSRAVPAVTSIGDGQKLDVDIDQIGSTVAGADLTVVVYGRPTI